MIEEMEHQQVGLENEMAHPEFYKNGEKVKLATTQYKSLEDELRDAYFRWNELTRELETLNGEFERELKAARD